MVSVPARPGYRQASEQRPEQRVIAEKVLGRKLTRREVVHHINGDGIDNRNKNLLVCTIGYHRQLHERMSLLYAREKFECL